MAEKPRCAFGPVNAQIGCRLRQARRAKGLSLEQAAIRIGVAYQQLQKYERGENALSVGRMLDVCDVLGINPLQLIADVQAALRQGQAAPSSSQAVTLPPGTAAP